MYMFASTAVNTVTVVRRRYKPPFYRQFSIERYLEAYLEPQAFKIMLYVEKVNDIKMLSSILFFVAKSFILNV